MLLLFIKFYLAILLSLFIPGYFFTKFFLKKYLRAFSFIEVGLFSFVFSLIATNFIAIVLDFLSIKITGLSLFLALLGFSFFFWFLSRKEQAEDQEKKISTLQLFSKKELGTFLLILALSAIIRTFYVADGIVPQTTDLGHHIYWSKTISQTGQLPNYGMPDFIIGEHIIFSVVSLLSGISYISAMPVAILFLVNIFSLIALSVVAFYIVKQFTNKRTGKITALLTLLIAGCFYATSTPQAKFISGGVIGNMIGNLLIPTSFLLFFLAIKKLDSKMASLFYICLAGLGFTHHLSTFIFLYVFVGFLTIFVLTLLIENHFNLSKTFKNIFPYLKVFLSKWNILTLLLIVLFMLFVHMPSYLNKSAIDTAVGAPSKSTRVGLSVGAISLSVGAWKLFYGILGILVLFSVFVKNQFEKNKKSSLTKIIAISLLAAWFLVIFTMSTRPALLKVDIISSRIVSYITFPLAILSAFFIAFSFQKLSRKTSKIVIQVLLFLVLGTGVISGFADISDSVRDNDPAKEKEVMQTYKASEYLSDIARDNEVVLKDHIHLEGDTWMKLFFMREYKYPLSRSYLRRYEDPTKKRETCTRDMIAIPDSEIGRECFKNTSTAYIVLKDGFDTVQFEKSSNFSKIYTAKNIVIYKKYVQE